MVIKGYLLLWIFIYAIIAFGYATFATFAFDKEWKDYEDHGEWQKDW